MRKLPESFFTPDRDMDPENRIEELARMLDSRQSTYGDFSDIAELSTALRDKWESLLLSFPSFDDQRMSLLREGGNMILHKLARIASGDHFARDSWLDIAGYAMRVVMELDRLAEEFCEKQREMEREMERQHDLPI